MRIAHRIAAATAVGSLVLAAGAPGLSAQPAAHHSRVTLRAAKQGVQTGTADRLHGRLTPGGAGRSIVLQRYGSAGWHGVKTTHTRRAGTYEFRFVVHAPGPVKLRVYAPSTEQAPSVISPSIRIVGLRWHYLSAMKPVRGRAHETGTVDVSGRSYPHSVQLSSHQSSPFATYDLRDSCHRVRATLGLDDDSDPGATATLLVSADGHRVFDHHFSVGDDAGINKSVKGRSRLRLSLHADRNPVSYGDFGTIRVLCAF